MKKLIVGVIAVTSITAVSFAAGPSPTPSGIAPGGGLGIPQAKGIQAPTGLLNGTATVPAWSAVGAPSTPQVSGSIVGGGSTGPTGVTAAGSPNNPGVNQPTLSRP